MAVLGPNGAGKIDAAALPRRAASRSTHGRIALDGRGARRPRRRHVRARRAPPRRRGVPGLPAVRPPDARRQRGVRPAGARRPCTGEARRSATGAARAGRSRRRRRAPDRARCRAVSSSASRWPVRSPAIPRLLLLDEPLAALDVGTRAEVRRELRTHLAGFDGVRVLVTHDPLDAYALAERVVILEAGRVSQTGTVQRGDRPTAVALRGRPGRHQPAAGHRAAARPSPRRAARRW